MNFDGIRCAWRGLLLAAAHVALICGIAAKYAWDRRMLPREWIQVRVVDPDSFLRGRYLILENVANPRQHFEYFVPEHSDLPTRLSRNQYLWAEVTKAPNGPRPIRVMRDKPL
jgi:hypothetical protein